MDTIIIKNLEVFYRVGVPDEERSEPQRLLLTVAMTHDFAGAVRTDDLSQSIDYGAVSQRLLRFGDGRSWRLIETLAANVADMILAEFGPQTVCVEVKKFVIPEAQNVAVSLTRIRRDKETKNINS